MDVVQDVGGVRCICWELLSALGWWLHCVEGDVFALG